MRTQIREQPAVSVKPKGNDGLVKDTDRRKKIHPWCYIKLGLDMLIGRERGKRPQIPSGSKPKPRLRPQL